MSTSETAAALDLTEDNVKVRLHRVGTNAAGAFPFMGVRCDRVVQGVFARIAGLSAA